MEDVLKWLKTRVVGGAVEADPGLVRDPVLEEVQSLAVEANRAPDLVPHDLSRAHVPNRAQNHQNATTTTIRIRANRVPGVELNHRMPNALELVHVLLRGIARSLARIHVPDHSLSIKTIIHPEIDLWMENEIISHFL